MFGLELLSGPAQATATVGIVLAEAIVLYVGYGALTQISGPTVHEWLGGE
ncbi:DUF7512 family protein [Halorarum salinum]